MQGALVALDPDNGALELAGGFDFSANQFNHATQAARQPGSNFKPSSMPPHLMQGGPPQASTSMRLWCSKTRTLRGSTDRAMTAESSSGPLRLREALTRSVNLVSMRLLLDIGVDHTLRYAERLGFNTTAFPRNLQLAIEAAPWPLRHWRLLEALPSLPTAATP